MKSKIKILLTFALICAIFIGCSSTTNSISVAKSLDYNLNKLSHIVNKLDTVDNNYIANPEIYP